MLTFYCKETSHVFLSRPGIIHTHVQITNTSVSQYSNSIPRITRFAVGRFFSPDEIRSDNLFLVRPPRFPAAFPELRVLREENLIKQNVYIYIYTRKPEVACSVRIWYQLYRMCPVADRERASVLDTVAFRVLV